jgi:hypothetical protein
LRPEYNDAIYRNNMSRYQDQSDRPGTTFFSRNHPQNRDYGPYPHRDQLGSAIFENPRRVSPPISNHGGAGPSAGYAGSNAGYEGPGGSPTSLNAPPGTMKRQYTHQDMFTPAEEVEVIEKRNSRHQRGFWRKFCCFCCGCSLFVTVFMIILMWVSNSLCRYAL